MVYSDLIEYNIVLFADVPLLCWFPFISRRKDLVFIAFEQELNSQEFSCLDIRPQFRKIFQWCTHWLEKHGAEKKPFLSVVIPELLLMLRKSTKFRFQKTLQNGWFKTSRASISWRQKWTEGNGIGYFFKLIKRKLVSSVPKFIVLVFKPLGVDLLSFFVPEIADVATGSKTSWQLKKV